jgi:hypothetical protein
MVSESPREMSKNTSAHQTKTSHMKVLGIDALPLTFSILIYQAVLLNKQIHSHSERFKQYPREKMSPSPSPASPPSPKLYYLMCVDWSLNLIFASMGIYNTLRNTFILWSLFLFILYNWHFRAADLAHVGLQNKTQGTEFKTQQYRNT